MGKKHNQARKANVAARKKLLAKQQRDPTSWTEEDAADLEKLMAFLASYDRSLESYDRAHQTDKKAYQSHSRRWWQLLKFLEDPRLLIYLDHEHLEVVSNDLKSFNYMS